MAGGELGLEELGRGSVGRELGRRRRPWKWLQAGWQGGSLSGSMCMDVGGSGSGSAAGALLLPEVSRYRDEAFRPVKVKG